MQIKDRHSHRFDPGKHKLCSLDSGGSSTQTVTEKPDPWGPVQEPLKYGYQEARRLYDLGGPQYYPGETYIPPDPLENYAQNLGLNYATNSIPGQFNQAQQALTFGLNAADVANNPYVNSMLDVQADLANRNLFENLLTGASQGGTNTGQYSSSRQGVAEGIAKRGTQEAILNAARQTQMGAYQPGLDTMWRSMAFAPEFARFGTMPMEMIGNVGAFNRAERAAQLEADMSRYGYQQELPYMNLDRYMATLNNAPFGSRGTTEGPDSSMGASLLGGALLGKSLLGGLGAAGTGGTVMASSLGPLIASGAGVAAPLAGGMSLGQLFAAGGMASDRRLKKDIEPVGKWNGYQWYTFRYKDQETYGSGLRIGVMADEIERIKPEAVIEMDNGYKAVNYGAL